MVARVHYWKGQDYFLKIANRICKKGYNVHFVMIGDAYPGYEYLEKGIQDYILDNELSHLVTNLGYRDDIPDLLTDFDIFILPSVLPDPLPNTVLEAMASRVPVVATAHGGALEMVEDGKTGFLIPWDDEESAASIMTPLLKNDNLRSQFGLAARKRVEKEFSIQSFGQNLINTIEII